MPAGNQAAQDRSGPSASQDHLLLANQERSAGVVAACREASRKALTGTSKVATTFFERSSHPRSMAGKPMNSPRAAAQLTPSDGLACR